MAEYIDREALFAEFDRLGLGEHSIVEKVFSIGVRTIIAGMPAADVAPVVHGRWIPSESDFDDDDTLFDVEEWCDWQCSACREDICYEDPMPPRLLPKYCPNCGAKMDGGVDNETD